MGEKGISIVISTGTEEKMVMLGVLSQTAVNLGMPLRVFITGTAIPLFLKDGYTKQPVVPAGFEGFMKELREGLIKVKFQGWHELLQNSVKDGDAKIYACSLMSSALNLQKKDFDLIVEDIVGATNFMIQSAENQIIML
jgi:peroxiredoxin family protein